MGGAKNKSGTDSYFIGQIEKLSRFISIEQGGN